MIHSNAALDLSVALVAGFLLGSFIEYTVHRLMHKGTFMGKRHAKHHRNFGIGLSLWDRLLGTYRKVDWQPKRPLKDYPLGEFVSIRWR